MVSIGQKQSPNPAQLRLREIVKTGRTANMRVVHRDKGEMMVQAYHPVDAALFAMGAWGLDFSSYKEMKIYLAEPEEAP